MALAAVLAAIVLCSATSVQGIFLAHEGVKSCPEGTERFVAPITGLNNIAPNSTTPLPLPSPVKGVAALCVDEGAESVEWSLVLCRFTRKTGGYIQSTWLHVGSRHVDFPPPLVPLEPPAKPADPNAPPSLAPTIIRGCRGSEGSFIAADFVPLPPNVLGLPTFVSKLKAEEMYVNVHSVRLPTGEARGHFAQV
ncbi:MAG: hypothetical protein J3K34DRAFT_525740 [Monoraphidium minutum]|nr:MAG: hypothetical protein J3K34DRAFT_525740 [Monoraphidium minutum]